MDRPLEPGKQYRRDVIFLREQVDKPNLVDFIVRKALSDLVGPNGERIRMPIGTNAIRLRLTAEIRPWKL